MLVELVQTTTRDGIRLDGMLQIPSQTTTSSLVDAFLCIHGTGGNFYGSTLFDALAERLLPLGACVLRVNTRGHDLMCNVGTVRGGRRLGAAYEVVDDCRHDLTAWLDWLGQRGHTRLGLIGHSSGAVKCLYAQAHEPHPLVSRLIAISPPRLSHSWFTASSRASEFLHTYQQARQLLDVGEGATLLDVRLPMPFVVTAAGYVEKYGPDERYNYLKFIDQVGCPTLLTLGEKEVADNMAFAGVAEALAGIAPAVRVQTIKGADHFYTGVREELLLCVETWLAGS